MIEGERGPAAKGVLRAESEREEEENPTLLDLIGATARRIATRHSVANNLVVHVAARHA